MNTEDKRMSIKDGGPAFPSARDMRHNPDFDHEGGMSVRDHFAGLAMAALLGTEMYANTDSDIISGWAYAQADSMIRAREAGQ